MNNNNKGECDMYQKKIYSVVKNVLKLFNLKGYVIVFLFSFSFSAGAFFSPSVQNNCSLPMYLAALQAQGAHNVRQPSTTSQKSVLNGQIRGLNARLSRLEQSIAEVTGNISGNWTEVSRHIGDYDGENDEWGRVTEQIREYRENKWNKRKGKNNFCDNDAYHSVVKKYYAYLDAFIPPTGKVLSSEKIPPFSFAFLKSIAKKSLNKLVPEAAAAKDEAVLDPESCECGVETKFMPGGPSITKCKKCQTCSDGSTIPKEDRCPSPPASEGCSAAQLIDPNEDCITMGNYPNLICRCKDKPEPTPPPVETPPVETPPVETPPVETPPVETPPVETPPVETPP